MYRGDGIAERMVGMVVGMVVGRMTDDDEKGGMGLLWCARGYGVQMVDSR